MLLAKLKPGLHVAYQPHPSRRPQRVIVVDTEFLPNGKQGQALVQAVDNETGLPHADQVTFNVGVGALTETWEESLATQARIKALTESVDTARRREHLRLTGVATEIGALVGTEAGDLPVGVDANNNVVITLDVLLDVVKAARTQALNEFQGTGGRFGPAPA